MVEDITAWMREFRTEFETLETSRSTTLEVIGQAGSERDWQKLLAYFLDPNESHGLDTTVLEAFVDVIAAHPETTVSSFTKNFDTVTVETEVSTPPRGFADLLVWAQGEWFICVEMKVNADETDNQTERYAETSSLGSLVKSNHKARGGKSQYVYLAPDEASPPKEKEKFAKVPWSDIVSAFEVQLNSHNTNLQSQIQLSDFLQTIKKQLTMDEYNQISDEAQLYAENKSILNTIQAKYEKELNRLKDMMKEALEAEFQAEEWQTYHRNGRSGWIQLYKSTWHNNVFNIEYEPHFKLGKKPPQIRIRVDIENGKKQLKQDVLDYLIENIDESIIEDEEWVITGDVKPCLTKSIILDVDSPQTSIEQAVQAIRSFDTALGHHIDDAVGLKKSEQ